MQRTVLAQVIFNKIQSDTSKFGVQSVKKVALQIDRITEIEPDILQNEMRYIALNTPFKDTVWEIREMKIRKRCYTCNSLFEYSPEENRENCPFCNSIQMEKIKKEIFKIISFTF